MIIADKEQGIPAPESGSIALNGKIIAEQIGSQIFISWRKCLLAESAGRRQGACRDVIRLGDQTELFTVTARRRNSPARLDQ